MTVKFPSMAPVVIALLFSTSILADTIRLKDGTVIKGQIVGFRDQQFNVLIGDNARNRRSRILLYMEDVESIEFDSSTGPADNQVADTEPAQPPASQPPVETRPTPAPATTVARANASPFFKVNAKVKADSSTNGWTNTGLVARKGQRLKILASGRVSLGRGNSATPEGLPLMSDREKLMRNEPTGGLIAVIGDDNDDFIFVGRNREIVAQRDGVLFLGVNEGNLVDNTGAFDVVIEAEAQAGASR
jgi:small nuclear ribonucleoprotein (snRNP)-like protein